jgi:hypothetical protein
MAAKYPVVLILVVDPNIGQVVARAFISKVNQVGLAARSSKEADSADNQLNIPSDLFKTDDVVNAFDKVNVVFCILSVVVYNGMPSLSPVPSLAN